MKNTQIVETHNNRNATLSIGQSIDFITTEDGGVYAKDTIFAVTPIITKRKTFRGPYYSYSLVFRDSSEIEYSSENLITLQNNRTKLTSQLK